VRLQDALLLIRAAWQAEVAAESQVKRGKRERFADWMLGGLVETRVPQTLFLVVSYGKSPLRYSEPVSDIDRRFQYR